jgi:pimeloyl-ACP methyl ester carboxylesterase
MNTTDMSALNSNQIDTRTRALRRLGVALLAAALISATSCGTDTGTAATGTTTPSAANPTANSSPAPTTTSPAPTTTATAITTPRPTATIDQLVGAEGRRVHVRCVGQGETTVLLIAGFGGDATNWVKVEPAIGTRARVCSYDRPGTGTSDPTTSTATFTTQATELHALLNTIGEPGPYVVVGQSFGGAESITFASHFADEVTGLALIDASPTTWPAALCAVPDDGSEAAATVLGTCTGAFLPTGNSEHLDVAAAFAELSSVASLGSLPMAVITATERELPAGLAAPEVARLTEAWNHGQQDWIALSTSAQLVTVDHTGHHIEIDQPEVVIDEITHLLP